MFGFNRRPEGAPRNRSLDARVATPIALCLLVGAALPQPVAARFARQPIATISNTTLQTATEAQHSVERTLAARQRALRACLRAHPRDCATQRSAVHSAEAHLSHTTQQLDTLASAARHRTSVLAAPHLVVSGQTLSWKAVPGVSDYVFVRKVPGQADEYPTVTSTTITPAPAPGETVRYSVRTDVSGSAWAKEVSISYPDIQPVLGSGETAGSEHGAPSGASTGSSEGSKSSSTAGEGSGATTESGTGSGSTTETSTGSSAATETGTGSSAKPGESSGSSESPGTEASGETGGSKGGTPSESSGTESSSTGSTGETFGEPFIKGINTNIQGWGEALPTIVEEMGTLGVSWAREDLEWSKLEPQPGVFDWSTFDKMVKAVEARGITVLPVVDYAPSWTSPTNATDYAAFVKAAVQRYGPGTTANLHWWELWNEPYAPYAWSGHTPEPEAYARDAIAASQAAKSVSPSVKILIAADYQDSPQTGGSSPWQTTWIDDMFTAEPTLGQWIDGVSVHPYGDDPALPLDKSNGWLDASGEWAFQRIDNVRAKFLAHGVNVPFWITEVGWSTWEVSEAQQAHDYGDLITQVRARPWVRALFPYCLREFEANPNDNQSGFGLLKFGSWQPKSAFAVLQSGLKELH